MNLGNIHPTMAAVLAPMVSLRTYRASASALRPDGNLSMGVFYFRAPNLIDAWVIAEHMAESWSGDLGLRDPQVVTVKIKEE